MNDRVLPQDYWSSNYHTTNISTFMCFQYSSHFKLRESDKFGKVEKGKTVILDIK